MWITFFLSTFYMVGVWITLFIHMGGGGIMWISRGGMSPLWHGVPPPPYIPYPPLLPSYCQFWGYNPPHYANKNFGENLPQVQLLLYLFTMEYVLTDKQLKTFLLRRFTPDELNEMIDSVKEKIDEGESVETAVYDTIRHYIAIKKFEEINTQGTEQEYWDSYLIFETPLVYFIKSYLGLD